jgi:hypothetical protein
VRPRAARPTACALLLTAVALIACSGSDPAGPIKHTADVAAPIVIALTTDRPNQPSDPFKLDSARVEGDTLNMFISVGGGCRDHEFALVAVDGWRESYPVQVPLFLAHDAKGDMCRAIVSYHLRYDLAQLAAAYRRAYQTQSDSVALIVADRADVTADARVLYRF